MMNAKNDQTSDIMKAARESFSGKTLTEGQFHEAWAVAGIIHREIHKSGSFKDKLIDYAHAYARNEKFDAMWGETILRDIYKGRYNQTMKQTLDGLIERENTLPEAARSQALAAAESIGPRISDGATQPFYKAYDAAAIALASELNITQSGAKALMHDSFKEADGRDLYEAGKEIEEAYHKPVREAEIAARKAEKLQTHSRSHSMS